MQFHAASRRRSYFPDFSAVPLGYDWQRSHVFSKWQSAVRRIPQCEQGISTCLTWPSRRLAEVGPSSEWKRGPGQYENERRLYNDYNDNNNNNNSEQFIQSTIKSKICELKCTKKRQYWLVTCNICVIKVWKYAQNANFQGKMLKNANVADSQ